MAQQRSRRLRKKLKVDEFKEIGFMVAFSFAEGTTLDTVGEVFDVFMNEVLKPNEFCFEGSGYIHWEGNIHLQKIGASICTEEHRQLVKSWLEGRGLLNIEVSELMDLWWA